MATMKITTAKTKWRKAAETVKSTGIQTAEIGKTHSIK